MHYSKKIGIIFLIWAILIAYSRVYIGVHYPFDVFAGMIIGIVCGYLVKIDTSKLKNYIAKFYKNILYP